MADKTQALSPVTPELLPCPFCGGEAERFTLPEDGFGNGGGDVITCSRCQASSHVEFGRKENLVDRWNTRISHSLPGDVGAILDRIDDGTTWNSSPIQCLDRIGQIIREERAKIAALTPSALAPEHCQRCGHNNPSWSAPSPLWNAVIRGGSIDGEPKFDDMVCTACFMELAEQQGIASDWSVKARNVAVPLETTTPSGRVWDDGKGLWVSALSRDTEAVQTILALPVPLPGHWDTEDGRDIASECVTQDRARIAYGDKSDMEIANAVFMVDRYDLALIHYQTAAKERIRWLSAQLALANHRLAAFQNGAN